MIEAPRIVSIETEVLADPANPLLLVRVRSDDGLVGIGETWWGTYQPAAPPGTPVRAIAVIVDDLLTPACVGQDATDITGLWQTMHRLTYQYGPEGMTSTAIAGIDLALWDLAGRRTGRPTADLLGPRKHDAVPAYASLHWLGDAEQAVVDAARAVEAGFRGVKLHETRADIVAAVRATVGPEIALMLDVSARLNEAEAVELAQSCTGDRLRWIEEPVFPQQDHDTLARIRSTVATPLAAGENEFSADGFRRLLAAGAVDVIQPDPAKCGGLTPMPAIDRLALDFGAELALHNFSLGPSLGANIHAAMTLDRARWIEVPFLPEGQAFPGPWVLPALDTAGRIPYPTGPGLAW
ncbi:MAG: mandelate racemase/muconate lactonizing enzyme family protein [Acidimicrobiia bacterium]|nr:mandelate racemase/muconate lactonizing enzyme family protein [Acidimicrobiia bacterium]